MMGVTKEQVKWYFEETFTDHWEELAYFLNSVSETKEVLIEDIKEQTQGREYNG
jgi:hypothetical protein